MGYPCKVCGDPRGWLVWIDEGEPDGCPYDEQWHKGGSRSINNVTECSYQMRKAWMEAERRRLSPESFDEMGRIKPGELATVLQRFAEEHPGQPVI